jgi:glycosyltransferase involved in cell wall biosynthesis
VPETIPPLPSDENFRMIFSGRICKDKGVHVAVVAAVDLASDPEVGSFSIDIFGSEDEPYVDELKQLVSSKGLENKVRFHGRVPREQLEAIRQTYHAFLFTSIWAEPGAMVLIESMAYGLPVIASPAGGTAEYLIDEENALVFPIGDHKAMAKAIKRLMLNRDLLNKLREGGRRTALERFEFNKIIDEYESILKQAVEEFKARRSKMGDDLGKS